MCRGGRSLNFLFIFVTGGGFRLQLDPDGAYSGGDIAGSYGRFRRRSVTPDSLGGNFFVHDICYGTMEVVL